MNYTKEPINPWTTEDEREHFPCIIEWWGAESFFKTVEDNKKWSLKTSLSEWFTKPDNYGSNAISTLFNLKSNKQKGTHFEVIIPVKNRGTTVMPHRLSWVRAKATT